MVGLNTDAVLPDPTNETRILLLQIIRALVDEPESVELHCEEADGSFCFQVRVTSRDKGKIIGKHGRTARSIRTILAAVSMKTGYRYLLDIIQSD